MFSNHFITNCPANVPVKNVFENRSIFGEDVERKFAAYFFGHPVLHRWFLYPDD